MEIARNAKSILVGDNGSPEAERAVAFAFSLALCFQAKLVLLGVIAPLTPEQQAEGFGLDETKHEHEQMRARIAVAAEEGRAKGLEVTAEVVRGETREAIEHFVKDHAVDLLVIGHHDKSPLRRLLEGSTPDELAHHLRISILIVHSGEGQKL
jgi:nucleotide-binding universal stress UspA family protein